MADNDPGRAPDIPRFTRDSFSSGAHLSRIGSGDLGGKGMGLARADRLLSRSRDRGDAHPYLVRIPRTVVLTTEVFDAFLGRNGLQPLAESGEPDVVIAQAFLRASFPTEVLGDLRALIDGMRIPLAVRSSSLLEDSRARPFAGIYETKMTPNNQADPDERSRKFLEAVKLVYASTYFRRAKAYARSVGCSVSEEKMAVVIQEVIGSRRGPRFYPRVSMVARSYNFYASGDAGPEDGAVSLALGLGKTIVDGGACWTYAPSHPRVPPPYGSNRDLLRFSQSRFWSVNMGPPPRFDPLAETEYLLESSLDVAEYDGVLDDLASTWDAASDRLVLGTGRAGPRVLDFGPLLRLGGSPFNATVRELVSACRADLGAEVEVELAADWGGTGEVPLIGVLQVRPMVVAEADVAVSAEDLARPDCVLGSSQAVGHGTAEVRDVVFIRPDTFRPQETVEIAGEIGERNALLAGEGRPYLLIGFGRWGTTDPWGGIPVRWEQVDAARAIVEVSLPSFRSAPSQGSHFFHNVTSLQVLYLAVDEAEAERIDWARLSSGEIIAETGRVRHVRFPSPLRVEVDGRSRRGRVTLPGDGVGPQGGSPGRHRDDPADSSERPPSGGTRRSNGEGRGDT